MAPIDSSSSYVVFLIKVVEEYMNMIWMLKYVIEYLILIGQYKTILFTYAT